MRRDLGHAVPMPMPSARGIRQLEVLHPHHEDDIVPVILEEPDHHGALAVALHVGHRFGRVERVPIRRTATASAIRAARPSTWSI